MAAKRLERRVERLLPWLFALLFAASLVYGSLNLIVDGLLGLDVIPSYDWGGDGSDGGERPAPDRYGGCAPDDYLCNPGPDVGREPLP